jgi:hypothetical protein
MAELQLDLKQDDQAAATYKKILDTYEKKLPLASLRYRWGKIYYDRGEVKKAADVWKNFGAGAPANAAAGLPKEQSWMFWQKLADEKLRTADWNEDYKKYFKRIPAMSSRGTNSGESPKATTGEGASKQ